MSTDAKLPITPDDLWKLCKSSDFAKAPLAVATNACANRPDMVQRIELVTNVDGRKVVVIATTQSAPE